MRVKVIEDRSKKASYRFYFLYKKDYDKLSDEDKKHCTDSSFGYQVDDYLIKKLKLDN